jgi:hypothetical protein
VGNDFGEGDGEFEGAGDAGAGGVGGEFALAADGGFGFREALQVEGEQVDGGE